MSQNDTKNILSTWFTFKYKLLISSIAVGLLSGAVVVAYRFVLEEVLQWSLALYDYQKEHLWLIPIWAVVLAAAGWVTGLLVKAQPITSGSGIPQVIGVLQGKLEMVYWKALLAKFIGGTLSIGAGLSLGREGPSIQLGASVGQGFSRWLRRVKVEENFLITCGASAGLSAAFNAPIAGVIFALEEIHSNFSPIVMVSALAASLAADFVSTEFFGMHPIFHFADIGPIPLHQYAYLIILGVLVGAAGTGFNQALYFSQRMYGKLKAIPPQFRLVIPFLLAGALGLFFPRVLGGGNDLVNELVAQSFTMKFLLLVLVVKFVFTIVSYGSSAPGGIFLPMLVVGGMMGVIYSKIIHGFVGGEESYLGNFLILGMAGYFTASVKAPITGIILITEMTGSFSNLLSIGVVCLTSYMAAELLRSRPVYKVLLENFLSRGVARGTPNPDTKIILEFPIHTGCKLDGILIKDVQWPAHCLIVSVKRGERELSPRGVMEMKAGDTLVILTNDHAAPQVRDYLSKAVSQLILSPRT